MAHNPDASAASASSIDPSLLRRSWHVMTEMFTPFSQSALAKLPNATRTPRYTRADAIPDAEPDEHGEMPTVRDYHAINAAQNLRVPRKIATPVRVESKVWFANERTWISYLSMSILIGTLAMALFNASKDNITRYFSYFYALVSVGILIYGYVLYQHRITKIRRRDPGHFDAVVGPVVISALLFFAILVNFIVRVRELQNNGALNALRFLTVFSS